MGPWGSLQFYPALVSDEFFHEDVEYNPGIAMVIARVMSNINSGATAQGASFAQQYIYQRGIKKFGERGSNAATKELDQLHR